MILLLKSLQRVTNKMEMDADAADIERELKRVTHDAKEQHRADIIENRDIDMDMDNGDSKNNVDIVDEQDVGNDVILATRKSHKLGSNCLNHEATILTKGNNHSDDNEYVYDSDDDGDDYPCAQPN